MELVGVPFAIDCGSKLFRRRASRPPGAFIRCNRTLRCFAPAPFLYNGFHFQRDLVFRSGLAPLVLNFVGIFLFFAHQSFFSLCATSS